MSIGSEVGRVVERLREAAAARALARSLRLDRPTLVFGSAPGPELPAGWRLDDPLVTINASQVSAASLGLGEPALTVLSVTLLGSLDANREAQRVLAGGRTRNLLVVSHADEWRRDSHLLDDIGYRAARRFRVTTRWRSRVLREAIGVDAGRGDSETVKVSNGVYAICQALALGAPRVVVAGFSLSPAGGHAYNALGHPRQHVDPDRRAFAALAALAAPDGQRGRVLASTSALAAELGLPAWPG